MTMGIPYIAAAAALAAMVVEVALVSGGLIALVERACVARSSGGRRRPVDERVAIDDADDTEK